MDQRSAKRRACYLAATMIEDALAVGQESIYRDAHGRELAPGDVLRVEAALRDVQAELDRRCGDELAEVAGVNRAVLSRASAHSDH